MSNTTLMIKSATDSWFQQISRTDKLIDSLTDEQLESEIAPGKNRGVYLLGHLTTVHDRMLPLLNFGNQLYPQLENIFLTHPDKAIIDIPLTSDLRKYWNTVNEALASHINALQPEEWLHKHSAVSEEDFKKEPHRNRLNVLLNRTNHVAYHLGQIVFLKK
ncbi:MAG: DinB family protein [Bacteroidetes bacterium]|nr:DinB family protein [Bacteroidota bacterium]